MARIIILGSAAAVNDAEHDYTHFIIEGESGPILIDCGSNPLGKIHKLGINDDSLQDMILTHFHPDHVSGVPNMFMHMWLLGRKSPLRARHSLRKYRQNRHWPGKRRFARDAGQENLLQRHRT